MNLKKSPIIAIILTLSFCSSNTNSHQNPYSLDLITTMREYQRGITENPDNQLINIATAIPSAQFDIKYATDDNFVGQAVYSSAKAFARKPVVEALGNIQEELKKSGLGLKIFDAYRPYAVTIKFYDIVQDSIAVAAPWHGSRHNRGCALDLTLIELESGIELDMPTPFDVVNEYSHAECSDLDEQVILNRDKLINIMKKYGFSVYPYEWWHFDFNGWENYKLMDIPFEKLKS